MYSKSPLRFVTLPIQFQLFFLLLIWENTQLCLLIKVLLRAIPEKKYLGGGGGERRQAIYFTMDGWCGKFSNYMGHWCLTNSNYMGSWCFPAWKGKKEYYLPKKERSFI